MSMLIKCDKCNKEMDSNGSKAGFDKGNEGANGWGEITVRVWWSYNNKEGDVCRDCLKDYAIRALKEIE